MKQCSKCKKEYPATLAYFYANKRYKDGLHFWCKNCCEEYKKEYRIKNKESIDKYKKEWRDNNKKAWIEIIKNKESIIGEADD